MQAYDRNPSVRRTIIGFLSFGFVHSTRGTRKRWLDDLAAAADGLRTFDARLDHNIHRAAGHNQVFGVIAPDEDEASPPIKAGLRNDFNTGLLTGPKQAGCRADALCVAAPQEAANDDGRGNEGEDREVVENVQHSLSARMIPRPFFG